MTNSVIEIENLTKDYGEGRGIFGIDLQIRKGEMLGFAGTNGSGKTTLVRLLLGELTPTTGTVERADLSAYYLDQEYKTLESNISVLEMAERHNAQHLADHELKIRLNRACSRPRHGTKHAVC